MSIPGFTCGIKHPVRPVIITIFEGEEEYAVFVNNAFCRLTKTHHEAMAIYERHVDMRYPVMLIEGALFHEYSR